MGQTWSLQKQIERNMPQGQNQSKVLQILNKNIRDYDISPDNQQVAIACGHIRIYNLYNSFEIAVIIQSTLPASIKYSSDCQLIASREHGVFTCIWNAKSHERIYKIRNESISASQLIFSPDNQQLVQQLGGFVIRIWNFKGNHQLILNHGDIHSMIKTTYIHNQMLVSATSNNINMRFWNLNTKRFTAKFISGSNYLVYHKSSSNGQQILTAQLIGFMKYWDTKSKKMIRKFRKTPKSQVVALYPDSKLIASICQNQNQMKIHCSMTAMIIKVLYYDENDWVHKTQFSQDSQYILWNTDQSLNITRLQN